MPSRLGIDVGGTFTDFLLLDEATGKMHAHKILSTLQDPSAGVLNGITELVRASGIEPGDIKTLLHATTVPLNTVLQQTGAKVGLLVTRGFEQVLHLAQGCTPGSLTGWMGMEKPDPLADLELTRGIVERVSAKGDTITQLDEAAARHSIRELLDAGVDCITVALMHSYANPAHEMRLKAIIGEMSPELPVSVSCELAPEAGEYERALTSVMNAYIQPGMQHYLSGIDAKLQAAQINAQVNIVQSTGGLASARQATETPVHALLSGPAGGAAGAAYVASVAGFPDALAFDMGGTSADISLIRNGMTRMANETVLGEYPVGVPGLDVRSIGAGGGSIAHVPVDGMMRVGPQSAGAEPGPACYGKGGRAPTVTDAHVVLGRLPPRLPGDRMVLDVQAAEEAVGAFGRQLGLDRHRAAEGIVQVLNENMAGALRLAAVEKRIDPAGLALVAFGGAGPMHGCDLAGLIGMGPVIVPPSPGVLSAMGFLCGDITRQFARTIARSVDAIQADQVAEIAGKLGAQAKAWLQAEGVAASDQNVSYRADVRYAHQQFQVSLEVDPAGLANGGLKALAARLDEAHLKRYGLKLDLPAEIVTLRAIGAGKVDKAALPKFESGGGDASRALVDDHQVYFEGGFINTGIYDRANLTAGNQIAGPAVVTQKDSTTVIPPGYLAVVDQYLNLVIRPQGQTPERRH